MKRVISIALAVVMSVALCFSIVGCTPSEEELRARELAEAKEEYFTKIETYENTQNDRIQKYKMLVGNSISSSSAYITSEMLSDLLEARVQKAKDITEQATDKNFSYEANIALRPSLNIMDSLAHFDDEDGTSIPNTLLSASDASRYFLAYKKSDYFRVEGETADEIKFAINQLDVNFRNPAVTANAGPLSGWIYLEFYDKDIEFKVYSDNDLIYSECIEDGTAKNNYISFNIENGLLGHIYFIIEKGDEILGYVLLNYTEYDCGYSYSNLYANVVKAVVFDVEQRKSLSEEKVLEYIEKAKNGEDGEKEDGIITENCSEGRTYNNQIGYEDVLSLMPRKDADGNVYVELNSESRYGIICSRQNGTFVYNGENVKTAVLKQGETISWLVDDDDNAEIISIELYNTDLISCPAFSRIMFIKSNAQEFKSATSPNAVLIGLYGLYYANAHAGEVGFENSEMCKSFMYESFFSTAKRLFENGELGIR